MTFDELPCTRGENIFQAFQEYRGGLILGETEEPPGKWSAMSVVRRAS
jgi:hypothetical protein